MLTKHSWYSDDLHVNLCKIGMVLSEFSPAFVSCAVKCLRTAQSSDSLQTSTRRAAPRTLTRLGGSSTGAASKKSTNSDGTGFFPRDLPSNKRPPRSVGRDGPRAWSPRLVHSPMQAQSWQVYHERVQEVQPGTPIPASFPIKGPATTTAALLAIAKMPR